MGSDLRFALRAMRKSPLYTAAAVSVLALGIGANTAIYTMIDKLVVRPVSYEQQDRIVSVMETEPSQVGPWNELSAANFFDYKDQATSFEHFAIARFQDVNLASGGQPEQVSGARITPGFFETFGAKAHLGRLPVDEDPRTVALSHGLWVNRFASDPSIVGKTIRLNSENFTVTGVLPSDFRFIDTDVWAPMILTPAERKDRASFMYFGVARLKAGATVDSAAAELSAIATRLQQTYPETSTGRGVRVLPILRFIAGPTREFLLLQLGAVGFVLLIACANVANLQLAQATGRRKEIAVRCALGAGRWQIARQLMAESLVIAVTAGAFSIILAVWCVDMIKTSMPARMVKFVPGWDQLAVDTRALLFTTLVALSAGLLVAILPALRASRSDLQVALREVPSSNPATHRLRNLLVAGEVALAVTLMIGAALMSKGFWTLLRTGEMHTPQSLLTFRLNSPVAADAAARVQLAQRYEQLRAGLKTIPGVTGVSATTMLPYSGRSTDIPFAVDGDPHVRSSELPAARLQSTLPDYFSVMQIPLVKGRGLDGRDTVDSQRAIVVSASMVRKLGSREPIGLRLRLGSSDASQAWTIVGVVGDVMHHWFTDKQPLATIYRPLLQAPVRSLDFAVRMRGNPPEIISAVRQKVAEFDPELPVTDLRTLDSSITDHFLGLTYSAVILSILSGLAVLLACIGIYAVISYIVAERTHEIGIRIALGASASQVRSSVMGRSLKLVGAGLVIGTAGAAMLARLLSSLLYGVQASDLLPYCLAALSFVAVGLVAAWIPARRAMRVDPMIALRQL